MNILVTRSKDGQQFDFSKVQANLGQIPNLNEYLIHYEDDTKISRGTYFLLNGEMSKHDGLSQEKLLARISSK